MLLLPPVDGWVVGYGHDLADSGAHRGGVVIAESCPGGQLSVIAIALFMKVIAIMLFTEYDWWFALSLRCWYSKEDIFCVFNIDRGRVPSENLGW